MKTEITKTVDGAKITVIMEKTIINKTAYADGWNVQTGKEAYRNVDILVEKGGKKITGTDQMLWVVEAGAPIKKRAPQVYGCLGGSGYLTKSIYDVIVQAIAQADSECNSAEYTETVKIETEKKETAARVAKRIAESDAKRARHIGWCNKCESYCYGDCES